MLACAAEWHACVTVKPPLSAFSLVATPASRPVRGVHDDDDAFFDMTPEDFAAMTRAANARKKVRHPPCRPDPFAYRKEGLSGHS